MQNALTETESRMEMNFKIHVDNVNISTGPNAEEVQEQTARLRHSNDKLAVVLSRLQAILKSESE